MMGERRVDQGALFYAFCLGRHVPQDHLLRAIDRFVDLEGVRAHLANFYSPNGRPSIDPELLIRMLLVGYRWFCRLGLDGDPPDHSTFSKNYHGRFRKSDLLRTLFEATVARCMAEGLVGGEGFATDASRIKASEVEPKFVSRSDAGAHWTGAHKRHAFSPTPPTTRSIWTTPSSSMSRPAASSARRRSARPAP